MAALLVQLGSASCVADDRADGNIGCQPKTSSTSKE